ncbi:MAG: FliM/FliN family flagellar motor switch protein [Paracoccaceae bacterium]
MDQSAVIRRKTAAAQTVVPETGGAEKAWPLALARAARDGMSLVVDVPKLHCLRRSLTELLDMPPDLALIAILEGPGEALGVLMVDQAVLAGLIEAQTVGKVSASMTAPRKPTRTDAAMVAGYLDAALMGLETSLIEEEDQVWAGGFRYASFLEDPRPLGLLLEDVTYRVMQAEVALGGGAKSGTVLLALPAQGRGRRPKRSIKLAAEPGAALLFKAALREQVMASDCVLQAVLYRMTIPLSAVMGLKIGDVVPLPMAALDKIALEGIDGTRRGTCKLGQNRGMRAVRVEVELAVASGMLGRRASDAPGQVIAAPEPIAVEEEEELMRPTGTG